MYKGFRNQLQGMVFGSIFTVIGLTGGIVLPLFSFDGDTSRFDTIICKRILMMNDDEGISILLQTNETTQSGEVYISGGEGKCRVVLSGSAEFHGGIKSGAVSAINGKRMGTLYIDVY